MHRRQALKIITIAMAAAFAWGGAGLAGELPASVKDKLASSTYVYISSQRKSGQFGKPAEIWFMYHQGAVWVASPPTTWRARRIKAGRTAAKIAVGKPDGPSFEATGSIVKDPEIYKALCETYAKKYPERWSSYEAKFRQGLADGSRLLIKYTPK